MGCWSLFYFIYLFDISTPPGIPAVQKGEFQGPNQNKAQRIEARLSNAEFQPGELKLARQNLTDRSGLPLVFSGKTEFLEDCTNPLENLKIEGNTFKNSQSCSPCYASDISDEF